MHILHLTNVITVHFSNCILCPVKTVMKCILSEIISMSTGFSSTVFESLYDIMHSFEEKMSTRLIHSQNVKISDESETLCQKKKKKKNALYGKWLQILKIVISIKLRSTYALFWTLTYLNISYWAKAGHTVHWENTRLRGAASVTFFGKQPFGVLVSDDILYSY